MIEESKIRHSLIKRLARQPHEIIMFRAVLAAVLGVEWTEPRITGMADDGDGWINCELSDGRVVPYKHRELIREVLVTAFRLNLENYEREYLLRRIPRIRSVE